MNEDRKPSPTAEERAQFQTASHRLIHAISLGLEGRGRGVRAADHAETVPLLDPAVLLPMADAIEADHFGYYADVARMLRRVVADS